jgi:peptidoglycan/LPS O-acetylase OafA/YrhL
LPGSKSPSDRQQWCMVLNLTGIRGVAAIWVVSIHYQEYFVGLLPQLNAFNFIFQNGDFGVDLFFCLSGFILGYVYLEDFSDVKLQGSAPKLRKYFLRRLARIYPTYLLTTILAGILFALAIIAGHNFENESGSTLSVANVLFNILGIQTWLGLPSLNGPAWSVSAEILAYILYPFFVFIFSKWLFCSKFRAFCTLIVNVIWYEISLHVPMFVEPRISQVLSEFFMGLSMYVICKDLVAVRKIIIVTRISLSCGLLIFFLLVNSEIILKSVIPLVLLLIIGLYSFVNIEGKGLSRRWIVNLGLWSYSLYLTHRLLQNVMSGLNLPKYEAGIMVRLLQAVALVVIPLVLAWVTTKFFENPCRRLIVKSNVQS